MSKGVLFPEGYYDGSIILVGLKRKKYFVFNPWKIFHPFPLSVWLAIGASIIFTGVIYIIIENINCLTRPSSERCGAIFYYSAMVFNGQSDFSPRSNLGRLITWSWTFWAMIVGSAYTASLATSLVAEQAPYSNQVNAISDVEAACSRVCVRKGGYEDELVTNKLPDNPIIRKTDDDSVFKSLIDTECDIAVVEMMMWKRYENSKEVNKDCRLEQRGSPYKFLMAGAATSADSDLYCTSLIYHVLNFHFSEMRDEGFITDAWEDNFRSVGNQNCIGHEISSIENDENTLEQFGLREMGGIFIIHFLFTVVALVLAIYRRSF